MTPLARLTATACTVPTDAREADGTLDWTSTTIVVVEVEAGGVRGLGYTYGHKALAPFIVDLLAPVVHGRDAFDTAGAWQAMVGAVRNQGRAGLASMAIAGVDSALWDLKARLLGVPLVALLGGGRPGVPVYGSGGFTSYTVEQLQRQLADWVAGGIARVKMKVGSEPGEDDARVRAAREAIGRQAELFVDANGAYDRKQALAHAAAFAESGVTWFEEPVSSDDLAGLRVVRDAAPPGMEIAAGEYGYDVYHFRRLAEAGAVDVLQADATRCAGITGFLQAVAIGDAWNLPLSSHTAPALHVHVCCAAPRVRHLEYFHDHVRVERLLFDGATEPVDGVLHPDRSRPGLGLELKRRDAERYAA